MQLVDEKHGRWQEELRHALTECTCDVTRGLLQPAVCLDPLSTALHLTKLTPAELVMLKPSLRRVVVRFQKKANQLGILELLPKIMRAQARHQRRRPSPLSSGAVKE